MAPEEHPPFLVPPDPVDLHTHPEKAHHDTHTLYTVTSEFHTGPPKQTWHVKMVEREKHAAYMPGRWQWIVSSSQEGAQTRCGRCQLHIFSTTALIL